MCFLKRLCQIVSSLIHESAHVLLFILNTSMCIISLACVSLISLVTGEAWVTFYRLLFTSSLKINKQQTNEQTLSPFCLKGRQISLLVHCQVFTTVRAGRACSQESRIQTGYPLCVAEPQVPGLWSLSARECINRKLTALEAEQRLTPQPSHMKCRHCRMQRRNCCTKCLPLFMYFRYIYSLCLIHRSCTFMFLIQF